MNTTSDPDPIIEKLKKIKPGGGSALYDAIYQACTNRKLVPGEPTEPRRVIIIIGDGHDNASTQTLDEVSELAQRNQVTIYSCQHGLQQQRWRSQSGPFGPGNRGYGGVPFQEKHLRTSTVIFFLCVCVCVGFLFVDIFFFFASSSIWHHPSPSSHIYIVIHHIYSPDSSS